jgi:POT family proton-dependent oligopeptide transporter
MPGGVPFIIGNEFAERFSFYGMKAILAIFMTQHLMGAGGQLDTMTDVQATKWIHVFVAAVYLTPLLGGLLADLVWGKYRTIIWLSIVYCLGHLALAIDDTRIGLGVGLGLIALGAGGIKPCVSAHVGDQFGKTNAHFLPRIFSWFYFAINFGSAISTVLTPWVLEKAGPNWAFGIPGALMLLATLVFWAGRWRFAHIPPQPRLFVRELFSLSVLRNLGMLMVMYWLFVAMFWALFDQTASRWVLQAEHMNRNLFGFELLSSQLQAANPMLVMIMIPLFSYLLYPFANRFFPALPFCQPVLQGHPVEEDGHRLLRRGPRVRASGDCRTDHPERGHAEHPLAALGLRAAHRSGGADLDHLPRVLLLPGPQPVEVLRHVPLHDFGVRGKSVCGAGERSDRA